MATPKKHALIVRKVGTKAAVTIESDNLGELNHIAGFLMTDPERYKSAKVQPTGPFARVKALRAGHRVMADGGFTCIDEGAVLTVKKDKDGLFVPCRGEDGKGAHGSGKHYLDGQRGDRKDNRDQYVGLWAL